MLRKIKNDLQAKFEVELPPFKTTNTNIIFVLDDFDVSTPVPIERIDTIISY